MSGDVGAEVAAVLAEWWHRELGLQCVHDDRFVPSCEKWATQFLRTGIAALAPLIAERVEAAKAEAVAPIRALADELQRDIEDRREDTPADDGSWPITRAEWVGHIAGLGDALTQLRAALDPGPRP